jgi:hypothetical protein
MVLVREKKKDDGEEVEIGQFMQYSAPLGLLI